MTITDEDLELYHIGYTEETVAQLPSGFKLLNNIDNIRPDWYEYWPIRNFLLNKRLEEGKYYGFFSPKFKKKTGIDPLDLRSTICNIKGKPDVIFICPQPEVGAIFKNLYYGSDFTDRGALKTASEIFRKSKLKINLESMIQDSRSIIFSNYFLANSRFWKEWLDICETIYINSESEQHDNDLYLQLNKKTNYGPSTQRKVFMIEGVASTILQTKKYNSYGISITSDAAKGNFNTGDMQHIICDSLKIAYNETKDEKFLLKFEEESNNLLKTLITKNEKIRNNDKIKQTPAHDGFNDTIFSILMDHKPKNIVEVGCMKGTLAKNYRIHFPDCNWHGIDIDEDNINEAKLNCTSTQLVNIEELPSESFEKLNKFDTWIFGDVLEHLYNPWRLLKKIKDNSNGQVRVIACIPNSQHWNFQARINAGLMQYQNDGLFDRTHIRFFSRITMIEMFEQADFSIEQIISRKISQGGEKYMQCIRTMAELSGVNAEQAEADSNAIQYVIVATHEIKS